MLHGHRREAFVAGNVATGAPKPYRAGGVAIRGADRVADARVSSTIALS